MNRISKMNGKLQGKIESLLARRQLKTFMKKTAFGMSCVAVFCVVYALVAPALTVEWPPKCGLEEHTHTDECYGIVTPVEMNCTLDTADADIIIHTHDDFCYDGTGKLICELQEVQTHTHDETCYILIPSVDLEDREEDNNTIVDNDADTDIDVNTDDNTDTETNSGTDVTEVPNIEDNEADGEENGSVNENNGTDEDSSADNAESTDKENVPKESAPVVSESGEKTGVIQKPLLVASLDDTLPVSDKPVCGMEEIELHTHTASCYDSDGNLVCDKHQVIAHQHTAEYRIVGEPQEGYICGLEEHTHTDLCWLNKQPEYFCGLEEHTHTAGCYNEAGETVCGKIQHSHTEICEAKHSHMSIDEDYVYETDKLIVNFHIEGEAIVPGGVEIPENAEFAFTASESEDYDEYEAYAEQIAEDGNIMDVEIFEYMLTYGGYELGLADCEVTADIAPTEALIEYSQSADISGTMTLELESESAEATEVSTETGLMILASGEEGVPQEGIINEESAVTLKLRSNKVRVGIIETANPKFTVQYYAPLQRIRSGQGELSGYTAFEIIDTDNGTPAGGGTAAGGNLPKNGNTALKVKNIYVGNDGKVATETTMTEIYKAKEFTYLKAPNLKYFNIVTKDTLDGAYELDQVWILEEGGDPNWPEEMKTVNGVQVRNWAIKNFDKDLKFTNRKESAINDRYVFIDENSVIRLVYRTNEVQYGNPVNFYDYDISDGYVYETSDDAKSSSNRKNTSAQTNTKVWFSQTNQKGINSAANYTGSGAKLGFGNSNGVSGSGMESQRWNGNALNIANGKTAGNSYQSCTFGIASSMNVEDSTINYSSGVTAPKLFNEAGDVTGKTSYMDNEYSLEFNRVGDSYTLSAVNGKTGSITQLDTFKKLKEKWASAADKQKPGYVPKYVWSNNFWPMDNAPSYGTDGHDMKFGDVTNVANRRYEGATSGQFPTSDDDRDHNAYFGMQFAVQFEITKDYAGPLEYYFFGDDDMWIFLNGRLVCDIGGIHPSTGEYVNLWDYIDKNELEMLGEEETKTYTLTFFYTERGASGSTCWMNFTLPTVVGVNLEKQLEDLNNESNGALWIEKFVDGIVDPDAEFEFKLDLFTIEADGTETALPDNYGGEILTRDESGSIIKGDEEDIIHSGDTFKLKNGGAMVIYNMPAQIGEGEDAKQVYYRVEELPYVGYHATHSVSEEVLNQDPALASAGNGDSADNAEGTVFCGQISANILDKVVYTNHAAYELPNTGGSGTMMYTFGGLLVIGIATSFMYRKKLLQKERA
ncbi:MAG: fibro-slime domain-containing protein [Firmicutes bacterium]|nr:fibro-slime domain-containing protein [Bacillota bacterium]